MKYRLPEPIPGCEYREYNLVWDTVCEAIRLYYLMHPRSIHLKGSQ